MSTGRTDVSAGGAGEADLTSGAGGATARRGGAARPVGAAGGAGGEAAVEFRGIRRSYGCTHALAGLDLALRPGELLALLGPSGCG